MQLQEVAQPIGAPNNGINQEKVDYDFQRRFFDNIDKTAARKMRLYGNQNILVQIPPRFQDLRNFRGCKGKQLFFLEAQNIYANNTEKRGSNRDCH